ncbi:MAG: D-alanyl-D-alanine carboxypeptidase, partial [Clostridiales bacterium]|nr:D-alanyl-D-alanine carboxypeptidase [Clostridiales bacterium]
AASPAAGASTSVATSAQGAILIEAETGRVLWSHNEDRKLPMASTTKIITAITALEHADPSQVVRADPAAVGVEGSSIYLAAGEELTLEQLLYGLMLSSGNDAAVAIAIHVAGSVADFAVLMNETAARAGATNTHLMNPHGLHHPDHYTTAEDLARITAYAMRNEIFARIVSTRTATIPKAGESWNRTLNNKNKILWQYSGGNGVKTGFTRAAGRCLVAAARRDGMQLITVVLNCGPMFEDSMALLDYGFEHYEYRCVLEAGVRITDLALTRAMDDHVALIARKSIRLPLKRDGSETPVFTVDAMNTWQGEILFGQEAGRVTAWVGDTRAESPLVAARSVAQSTFINRLKDRIRRWYTRIAGS